MLDQIKLVKVAYYHLLSDFGKNGQDLQLPFFLGSKSSFPFDCTSRSVSVSPNRHLKDIENLHNFYF